MTSRGWRVALFALLPLAGCDRLFGLTHVDPVDAAPPDGPPSTVRLVQQKNTGSGTATTLTVTLTDPPASGDVLLLTGASDRYFLSTPTGGGVAAWKQAAASTFRSNIEIWYGVSDGSSSAVTIACGNGNVGNMRASVTEWTGLNTPRLFEAGGDGTGATTTPATAAPSAITTLDAPTLIVFGVSTYGALSSTASGGGTWTLLDSISVGAATESTWYQLAPAPGTFAPTVMVGGDWDAVIAAFRALP